MYGVVFSSDLWQCNFLSLSYPSQIYGDVIFLKILTKAFEVVIMNN